MTDFTNAWENKILDASLKQTAWTTLGTVYVALFSAMSDTEVPSGMTEISGTGYSRPAVTFGAASSGTSANTNLIELTNGSGGTWTISHIAVVLSSTLNDTTPSNFIFTKAFAKTVANGDKLSFAIGAITATVA